MSANRFTKIMLALLGVILLAGSALAEPRGRGCTKTAEITDAIGTSISSVPVRICSVHFIGTVDDSWAEVYDSPGNATHAQKITKAEPAVPVAIGSAHAFFGDDGSYTQFGLGAYVHNGRVIVHYDD